MYLQVFVTLFMCTNINRAFTWFYNFLCNVELIRVIRNSLLEEEVSPNFIVSKKTHEVYFSSSLIFKLRFPLIKVIYDQTDCHLYVYSKV